MSNVRADPLPLPLLIDALHAWQRSGGPLASDAVTGALGALVEAVGLRGAGLTTDVAPLRPISVRTGASADTTRSGATQRHTMVDRPAGDRLGTLVLGADEDRTRVAELVHAVSLAVQSARDAERARRAEGNLAGLDAAVRGIAGVLDLDRVLSLIVDRVRALVDAEYAALGIVDRRGVIERFVTSGLTAEERERIGDPPRGHGLLGLIIREGRTFRIADIATDPRRYGFPTNHPEMHPFLGVPILANGEIVGDLYLTNKRGGLFSEDDQRLVERFALHAGIAIDHARLHERVQALAVVEERERIGRDLHDGIIQRLYAVTLALDDVPELAASQPAVVADRVDRAIDDVHNAIRDIRNFISGLAPLDLGEGGLSGVLARLGEEVARTSGLLVEVEAPLSLALPIDVATELVGISREALSNAARHAQATRADVRVTQRDGRVRLEVSDDGRGFDPSLRIPSDHRGIANMRERAARLGAALEVVSQDGAGTRIILSLPLRPGRPLRNAE
jgi:signal transduction histidine kinase